MASAIGLKIANGEFYSIVEENSPVKKRLVLTTVHDKQRSVQIDLYKSGSRTMADAFYIGSLVMENIKPRPKGEPSIELIITSTKDGEITADAIDLDPSVKGEHQTLNVSLKSLDEDDREFEIPDFELEHGEGAPTSLYEKSKGFRKKEKRGFPWLVAVCAALIITAIGLALWLLLFKGGSNTDTSASRPRPESQAEPIEPQAAAPEPPPAQPASPAQTPQAAPPVIQAPARPSASQAPARRRIAPVASYKVPAVIPRGGARYTVRWGDTLWDISEAFYRNPWLYPRIARYNNIRNPNLIISGTTIRVPPRN